MHVRYRRNAMISRNAFDELLWLCLGGRVDIAVYTYPYAIAAGRRLFYRGRFVKLHTNDVRAGRDSQIN